MYDVTRLLSSIEHGDPRAFEELLPLIYRELRRLAQQRLACEKPGQTLQATALVHEASVRLVDGEGDQRRNSRLPLSAPPRKKSAGRRGNRG